MTDKQKTIQKLNRNAEFLTGLAEFTKALHDRYEEGIDVETLKMYILLLSIMGSIADEISAGLSDIAKELEAGDSD